MDEQLREELKRAGWKPGTFKGFLRTSRAGIEFQVGEPRTAGERRLELRYRYPAEQPRSEGEVTLPNAATRSAIEDAMTGVYLRIHEKPDVTRVFGGGRRAPRAASRRPGADSEGAQTAAGEQGSLDL